MANRARKHLIAPRDTTQQPFLPANQLPRPLLFFFVPTRKLIDQDDLTFAFLAPVAQKTAQLYTT